jgi:hypothetical protein
MLGSMRELLRRWTYTKFESHAELSRRQSRPAKRTLGFETLEERATPATILVTSNANAGTGSLRAALLAASLTTEADTIVFSSSIGSTITLTGTGFGSNASSNLSIVNSPASGGPLTIDGRITINGQPGRITLQTSVPIRIFDVSGASTVLNLQDINLNGGRATTGGGANIRVQAGTVSMVRMDVTNGISNNNGGGLANGGGAVTLNTVRFVNNRALDSGGGVSMGGGTRLQMTDVTFTGNQASAFGGGLFLSNIGGTNAALLQASFSGNSANEGGAIYLNSSNLRYQYGTVSSNSATVRGAGMTVNPASNLTVQDVIIGGDSAADANSSPFGAGITSNGSVNLERVTVANNSGGTTGGGIHVDAGSLTVINSTVSTNTGGAGIYIAAGAVKLINSTVAFNAGFGIRNGGNVVTGNTIYASNGGGSIGVGGINSLGTNLFSDAGPSSAAFTDLKNTNPLLLPLAANGDVDANGNAVTLTHAIQPGSPAFNAGNTTLATTSGLRSDQRGSVRVASGFVDIGAYELLDTLNPTGSFAGAPPNFNSSNASATTSTIIIAYGDPIGTGLQVTSGVDPSTFGVDDIIVTNGATIATVTAFNNIGGNFVVYTVAAPGGTWGNSAQGTYTVTIAANNVRDRALNGIVSSSTTFLVDTVPPTAALTTPPATINSSLGGTSTNTFTVTFSDASGIRASTIGDDDFTVSNGATVSLLNVSTSGTNATATYRITAPSSTWDTSPQGTYTISLVAGSVLDNAGNPIAGNANFGSFVVSTIRPFATMTTQPPNITVANAAPGTNSFTITYATLGGSPLNPSTYGVNDVTVTNGATTLTVIFVSNNNNAVTYIVQAPGGKWTNPPQGQYTIALNGDSVFDTAGNSVAANPTIGFFNVDAFRPTATLTAPPAAINTFYSGPQSNSFTIDYADIGSGVDVTTFSIANVTVTNGATTLPVNTAMVSGTSVTYTVLAPNNDWTTAPAGTYTITIVGDSVKDLAGNGITANPNFAFFIVDLNRPTATLTTPPVNINFANSGPGTNTVTVTYADVGSGMNAATYSTTNLTVSNGATTLPITNVSAVGNVVTYTIRPTGGWAAVPEGTYTVSLNASAADRAGNTVAAVANFTSFTVDVSRPTVAVAPSGTLTNGSPIVFTITFSEPVTGLTTAGITVTNGTVGTLTQVSGSEYTLPVTPIADGFVTVRVNAGAAQDAANNPNLVSNTAVVESDRTGPVARFSAPSVAATVGGPVSFTVTWTDPHFSAVTLTAAQVILNTTGTAGALTVNVTGAGNSRVITLTHIYGIGTIRISLPAGVAVDTLGNLSAAAGPSAAFSVSGNRRLAISQPPAPATLLPGSAYVYRINFSNSGNQISPGARVIVKLPANATFLPGSSTAGWTDLGNGFYEYKIGIGLIAGGAGQLRFAVAYSAKTPPGAPAVFSASITDSLAKGAAVATSTVSSIIVDPNRLRWGR